MEEDKEKAPQQNRIEQDVQNSSRTMKPGEVQAKGSSPRGSTTSPQGGGTTTPKGQGRGWHGDSEGHAKAGSQSHKKSDGKKQ